MSTDLSLVGAPTLPAANRWQLKLLRHGASLAFLTILLVFAATAPNFLSPTNLSNVVAQSAILGILAFGLTLVIIGGGSNVVSGGLDLSLAANLGLSAAVYATLNNAGASAASSIALTLACGLAIGALNGLVVVGLRLPPLLATLASMNLIAGLELVLTENTVLPTDSPLLDLLSFGQWLGQPALAWVFLVVALLLTLLTQFSRYGLRLYAVGEYPEAATAAGLPVASYQFSSYLLSGLCGSLASFCSAAWFSGSTTGSGEMLLSVVAIAFLGSVFSQRLRPSITGTLLATLLVGFLVNGFQLLNISSFWVNGVQGVLILLVVASSSLLRGSV
ncbi:ABC transporter permease [Pseudomonas laurentiana]|uniref:ABC transporter permease n=1 Tax=Pseudomonas laurentiana TaxID=2364649 RepID=UPI00167BEB1F|nr:ABC transporter permease [Pseudomonas laurentiana]GGU82556.1 ABC transporter permease [Pseudomonas laurentiana]